MSHFYGVLKGRTGRVTRCGTKNSSIVTVAASWDGAVETVMYWDEEAQCNMVKVTAIPWHGRGKTKLIHMGIVG